LIIDRLPAEDVTLNGTTQIKGDLLIPGTPTVAANRRASLADVIEGPGSASPTTHTVVLDANAVVDNVAIKVDAGPRRRRRRRCRPGRSTSC
jgi:hypothetical protein